MVSIPFEDTFLVLGGANATKSAYGILKYEPNGSGWTKIAAMATRRFTHDHLSDHA